MLTPLRQLLHRIENGLLALLLAATMLLACTLIAQRLLFDSGWLGGEAATRTLVLWLAMFGAMAATRDHRHLAIDVLPNLVGPRLRQAMYVLTQLFAALVCGALAWFAWSLLQMEREAPSELFGFVQSWHGMVILPLGFGLMALRFLTGLRRSESGDSP